MVPPKYLKVSTSLIWETSGGEYSFVGSRGSRTDLSQFKPLKFSELRNQWHYGSKEMLCIS